MKRYCQIAALAAAVWAGPGVAPAESPPVDGVVTNEGQPLVFKKRARRQYNAVVSMDDADDSPAAPANAAERRSFGGGPDPTSMIGGGFLEPGASPPPQGPMQPQRRPSRKLRKDDDEWKLTPQERIQREIDTLSGKSEDDEDEDEVSVYGWLADEIMSIRKEDARETAIQQQTADDEMEAEMIAAIIGRELPGSMKADERPPDSAGEVPAGRSAIRGAPSGTGPASFTASRAGSPAAASRYMTDEDLRAMAQRAVEESERQARAAIAAESRSATASGAAGIRPQEGSSGAPELFKWGESSGGGFAGLPSSLAPSLAPPSLSSSGAIGGNAFDPSSRPPSSYALPKPPSLDPSGAGWAGGLPSNRPQELPGSPAGMRPQEIQNPAAFDSPRSPFLSPMTPASSTQSPFSTIPRSRP